MSKLNSSVREWAYVCLEGIRSSLRRDESVYRKYGHRAYLEIDTILAVLKSRVDKVEQPANPEYSHQADLAAGLIVLGCEYPDTYTSLMCSVVGSGSIQTFDGALRLQTVLSDLSDDHEYILIQDESGSPRLHHDYSKPASTGFVPLTCSRDLYRVVESMLEAKGFFSSTSADPTR